MVADAPSRPLARGAHGAVSTPHLAASLVALDVLRSGGTAADAAVAAAAMCTVVQPATSTLLGVGWATLRRADGSGAVIDFHGRVPLATDPGAYATRADGMIDIAAEAAAGRMARGMLTPQVPHGWEALLALGGRRDLAAASAPAVDAARAGTPVSSLFARLAREHTGRLRGWGPTAASLLPGGAPPAPGVRLAHPDLAASLERVAAHGAEAELSPGGLTGRALLTLSATTGGWLAADDLAGPLPRTGPPSSLLYRGWRINGAPGPYGDVSLAQGLSLMELLGPFAADDAPDYVHASVEVAKLVAADRRLVLGPGGHGDELLAPAALSARASLVGPVAVRRPLAGSLAEDTITLTVIDAERTVVHLMQTVGGVFGTGLVAPGTGALANDSLHFCFAAGEGANRIVPGEPVEQNPGVVVAEGPDGSLVAVGSPGGKTRVQTVRQMLANVVDFGADLQAAVDRPRHLAADDGTVWVEDGPGAADLIAALGARGHRAVRAPAPLGSGQAVGWDAATETFVAAADHRAEAVALAW